jgi:hypothetical protein
MRRLIRNSNSKSLTVSLNIKPSRRSYVLEALAAEYTVIRENGTVYAD